MNSVGARFRHFFNNVPDDRLDALQLLRGSGIHDAEAEDNAPLFHALVVADAAFQKIVVGKNELLAAQAANARGLESDVLDRSGKRIHHDIVADNERFVQHDGQRRQQIAQNILHGQRHGDAADAQPRHEPRDVDAQIVQNQQEHDDPENHARHESQKRQRGGAGGVLVHPPGDRPAKPEPDAGAGPEAALNDQDQNDRFLPQRRDGRPQHNRVRRHIRGGDKQDEKFRLPQHRDEQIVDLVVGGGGQLRQPGDGGALDDFQNGKHGSQDQNRHEPALQGVSQIDGVQNVHYVSCGLPVVRTARRVIREGKLTFPE